MVCYNNGWLVLDFPFIIYLVCRSLRLRLYHLFVIIMDLFIFKFRYLPDFVYFLSLNTDKTRAAMIHVPQLNSPYTVDELADGLKHAMVAMLKRIQPTNITM